jgi:hypothetical protein
LYGKQYTSLQVSGKFLSVRIWTVNIVNKTINFERKEKKRKEMRRKIKRKKNEKKKNKKMTNCKRRM